MKSIFAELYHNYLRMFSTNVAGMFITIHRKIMPAI